MKASSLNNFRKRSDCPSSSLLLAFRSAGLSPQISKLVQSHLSGCEFCGAEVALLAHHTTANKKSIKAPELPINLRILAESILSQSKKIRKRAATRHGLLLAD
jgi:hypothetical protein